MTWRIVVFHLLRACPARYRHKHTGIEFHHSFTQTPRPPAAKKAVQYHREVQTYESAARRGTGMGVCARGGARVQGGCSECIENLLRFVMSVHS